MKILTLHNFYPPYERGGQDISCKAIVDGLRGRGHTVEVLTSDYGSRESRDGVYRELRFEMDLAPRRSALQFFTRWKDTILYDQKKVMEHVARLQPDLIFICGMWNIPRQVPALAEKLMPGRVLYRFACYWPSLPSQYVEYWKAPAQSRMAAIPKRVLGVLAQEILKHNPPPPLELAHTICISEAVQAEYQRLGIHLPDVRVIHNGIDSGLFDPSQSNWLNRRAPDPLRLLYLGRISPEKGVHTAVEALKLLLPSDPRIRLTLVGSPWDASYQRGVEKLADSLGVAGNVRFAGQVAAEQVPALLQEYDVLLVPSIWPEPFGRVVLEGMAAGLVVAGTAQGGMGAVLKDMHTGLVFPPEDASALADSIRRLAARPELGYQLAATARQFVLDNFTLEHMVDRYEQSMLELVAHPYTSREQPAPLAASLTPLT